MTIKYMCMYIW